MLYDILVTGVYVSSTILVSIIIYSLTVVYVAKSKY